MHSQKERHFIKRLLILSIWAGLLLNGPLRVQADQASLLHYKLNARLPSFKLNKTGGTGQYGLSADGRPAVIMFFSTRPPFRAVRSIKLAEVLSHLSKKFQRRVDFMAVYSGRGDIRNNKQFNDYRTKGLINIPILDDRNQEIYRRYGVFMLPMALITDQHNRLQAIIPYTANIERVIGNNLRFILGDWDLKRFKKSLTAHVNHEKSKKEKAYIRRINYGRVMLDRGIYSAALREFNTAAQIMPKSIEATIGRGQVLVKMKKWRQAIKAFKKALKFNKNADNALSGLGFSLYRLGDTKQALPILENALICPSPDIEVVLALADIYEQKGNLPKALRLNKLAISILWKKLE
ncbi:MAG TPA: tetratricopeptide repeat protein [Desulfobacterales bacterium]|nr:tetratricopeptide repeat protein [Desulfobacterales bacterium]